MTRLHPPPPSRWAERRADLAQVARFGIVGVLATIANFVVTVLGIEQLGMSPPAAASLAAAVAFAISYAGHRSFTFRAPADHGHYLPRFFALQFSIWLLCTTATWYATARLHIHHRIVAAAVCVAWPLMSFLAARLWVFAPRRADTAA